MHSDRRRQVKTTRKRHGKDHYAKIGTEGGKKSPAKFDSERGRAAAKIRWENYRKSKQEK